MRIARHQALLLAALAPLGLAACTLANEASPPNVLLANEVCDDDLDCAVVSSSLDDECLAPRGFCRETRCVVELRVTDDDGDGFAPEACLDRGYLPFGFECPEGTTCPTDDLVADCDDAQGTINPGVEADLCNDVDDDCDGQTDEDEPAQDFYADRDADGHGDPGASVHVCADARPDGYIALGDDCDDRNATIFPGATERCDRIYNDCESGLAGLVRPAEDVDGDGFAPANLDPTLCVPSDAFPATDCDDTDATVYPGAKELCDRQWNDCSAGAGPRISEDIDGDGFASPNADCTATLAFPKADCNDSDNLVFPGAPEICDRRYNDCNTGLGGTVRVAEDVDDDGHADPASACEDSFFFPKDDCDDAQASVYPGAPEVCDRQWNNCSAGSGVRAEEDMDGDGYSGLFATCFGGFPRTDCDDDDGSRNPGVFDECNAIDDDCDGVADDGDPPLNYYVDADGDGSGDPASIPVSSCTQPAGRSLTADDCNDNPNTGGALQAPTLAEACDSIDNDCDGMVDDGLAATNTWYGDLDGDGRGTRLTSQTFCQAPGGTPPAGGWADNADDCDDGNEATYRGAAEVCDRFHNDCCLSVDTNCGSVAACQDLGQPFDSSCYLAPTKAPEEDLDNDGYATSAGGLACTGGFPTADCDDTNPAVNPNASEGCDGVDNDCDGSVDEDFSTQVFYADTDGDGYGSTSSTTNACSQPAGYGSNPNDCYDGNRDVTYCAAGQHAIATGNVRDMVTRQVGGTPAADVIVAGLNIYWYENQGTGAWTKHTIDAGDPAVEGIAAVDGDADGKADLVYAADGEDAVHVYQNQGSEPWAKIDTLDVDTTCGGAIGGDAGIGDGGVLPPPPSIVLTDLDVVAAGDVDGDGDIDVVAADGAAEYVVWWRNDGGCYEFGVITTSAELRGPSAIALADLGNDGDLDLAVGASDGPGGDPDGFYFLAWDALAMDWAAPAAIETNASLLDSPGDVDWVDINKDGKLDILGSGDFGTNQDSGTCYWINTSTTGSFGHAGRKCLLVGTDPASEINVAYDAEAADVDGNGVTDFVAAVAIGRSTGTERILLWLNPLSLSNPTATVRQGTYAYSGIRLVDVAAIYNGPGNSGLDVVGAGIDASADVVWFESNGGPFGAIVTGTSP